MTKKKLSIYKVYDSYTAHEEYFIAKPKLKDLGKYFEVYEDEKPTTERFEITKIAVNQ